MYEAGSSINKQSYSIGKGERPGIASFSPGPGAYEANDSIVKSGSK